MLDGSCMVCFYSWKSIYPCLFNPLHKANNLVNKHYNRYVNWGVCFIYGTVFSLGGLAVAGKNFTNCAAMRKAVSFLLTAQRKNGGWEESYLSCPNKVITQYNL